MHYISLFISNEIDEGNLVVKWRSQL